MNTDIHVETPSGAEDKSALLVKDIPSGSEFQYGWNHYEYYRTSRGVLVARKKNCC